MLKDIVDKILKSENRSLSWLAGEMDMTFDGLKLSLLKGSLKYNDIKRMADILHVEPHYLFNLYDTGDPEKFIMDDEPLNYSSLKGELRACKELIIALRAQLKDKEKIIELLGGDEK